MKLIHISRTSLFISLVFFSFLGFAQPTLKSPSTFVNQSAKFTINLNAYGGASNYDIELSHDGSFTGTAPNYQSKIAGGRKLNVTGLTYGGSYDLRWKADNSGYSFQTITIKSSPETYAKIVNGTTFGDTENILPKSEHLVTSYDWEFDTTLAFNSSVKVSATTNASSSNGLYSYSALDFLENEQYYVRVRGNVSSQSLVGDWSTDIRTFFTSEAVSPTLQNPEENATDLDPGFLISIGSINGASNYDIELSDDSTFAGVSPDYQAQIAGNRIFTVSNLNYGGTYNLRWTADNSGYGATKVTIKDNPITYAQITNGTVISTDQSVDPFPQDLVTSYEWEIDTTLSFNSALKVSAVTDASVSNGRYTLSTDDYLAATTYYIRVRAIVSSQSLTGPYSTDIRNFSVGLKSAPTLNSPADGAIVESSFTMIIGVVTDADSYEIELSHDSSFTGSAPNYQTVSGRILDATGLGFNQVYHARYRSNNSEYGTATFTTHNGDTYADIVNGTYLDFQTGTVPVFSIDGATGYDWEFDTVNTFDSPDLVLGTSDPLIDDGAYTLDANDFISGELYYVRVKRSGSVAFGSEIRNFFAPLHLAIMSDPLDGSVRNNNSLKLECFVVSNATDYEFEFADNPSFSSSTTFTSNRDFYNPGGWDPIGDLIIKAYDHVSGLDMNTDYYVRARAFNTDQSSEFGTSVSFNTGTPAAPNMVLPGLNATDLNAKVKVSIGTAPGSPTYDIEISHDGSYTGVFPDYQAQLGGGRIANFTGLTYGGTYFIRWRTSQSGYASTTVTIKDSPETFANFTDGSTFGATKTIFPKKDQLITSYDWEFDTAPTFDSPDLVIASTDASSNNGAYSYESSNFLSSSTYFVRVRGIVSTQSLTGDWSTDIRSFNTGSGSKLGEIESENEALQLIAYPNPALSEFNILTPEVDNVSLSILNVSGQVKESYSGSGGNTLKMGNSLPTGIYILNYTDSNGNSGTLRLVKN